jgi:tripartite-type tricarboxylate transporter receptor subunit TctC
MKLPHRTFLRVAAGAAALPVASRVAQAQTYPTRPIRLVIPFPPGGAFDAVGRPMADKMKPTLGTVVIENIGGGGGSLGVASVARARPDGHTLVLGGTITHVNEALLKSRPQYDPVKDLEPIAGVAANVLCIAVHPSVPAQTLKEFIAYAKANRGKLSYGHAGIGSIQHLTGELFKSLAGTPEIVQVPYRGTCRATIKTTPEPVALLGARMGRRVLGCADHGQEPSFFVFRRRLHLISREIERDVVTLSGRKVVERAPIDCDLATR